MLDYITGRRPLDDNQTGVGYVIVRLVSSHNKTYRSIYNDNPRGYTMGKEIRSRTFNTVWAEAKDGRHYQAGFIIYPVLDEALEARTITQTVFKVDYRGRICHGMYNGHRITVAKYRTLKEII